MSETKIEEIIRQAYTFATPIEQSMSFMQKGREYAENEMIKEAEVCFTQALEIQKKNNDIPGAASSLYMLGQIWASYGDFESAVMVLKEACEIFLKLGADRELLEAQETIAQIEMAALSQKLGKNKMKELVEIIETGDRDAVKKIMSDI